MTFIKYQKPDREGGQLQQVWPSLTVGLLKQEGGHEARLFD